MLIREDRKRGLYVEHLSEWVVRNPSEVQQLLRRGSAVRATGATRANEASSRSHAVFIIVLEQARPTVRPTVRHAVRYAVRHTVRYAVWCTAWYTVCIASCVTSCTAAQPNCPQSPHSRTAALSS